MLKEGLYEDREQRDELFEAGALPLDHARGLVSLDRLRRADEAGPGGDLLPSPATTLDLLRKSPQLEGFRARGVEVLLLTDPIDEFWAPAIGAYQGKAVQIGDPRRATTSPRSTADEGKKDEADKPEPPAKLASLIAMFKLALGDAVKDVRSLDAR